MPVFDAIRPSLRPVGSALVPSALLAIALIAVAGLRSPADVIGTVQDAGGAPAPNVTVRAVTRGDRAKPMLGATVRTDAKGEFRLALRSADPQRRYGAWVVALADDSRFGYASPGPQPEAPVTIKLRAPTTQRIAFVDAAGRPAAGLKVRVSFLFGRDHSALFVPAGLAPGWERTTDAAGRCVFAGLPQGQSARLEIDDERYAALTYEDNVDLADEPKQPDARIVLAPGASIDGVVTYAGTGKPAVGVRVGAQGTRDNSGWGESVTDAGGRYHIACLRKGVYNVALDQQGTLDKDWTAVAHADVSLASGQKLAHQDFALIPGVVITGKVTDRSNGAPISGVWVGVYGPAHPHSGAWVQSATTGADGAYRLRVPPGEQYVYVSGTPDGRYGQSQQGVTVTVGDGAGASQDFTLNPVTVVATSPVQVRVVAPDGKPVAGATVAYCPMSREFDADIWLTANTDASGACEVPMHAASVRLRARSGQAATVKTIVAKCGDTVTLTLTLKALFVVKGAVLDSAGKPLQGASVDLAAWWLDTEIGGNTVKTDAHGAYEFRDVWPDVSYTVSATKRGFGTESPNERFSHKGGVVTVPVIVLPRADRWVAGKVVDAAGKPVPHEMVQVSGRHCCQQVDTDVNGRFRCENLVDERLSIYVANGEVKGNRRVYTGYTDVVVIKGAPQVMEQRAVDDAAAKLRQALMGHQAPVIDAVSGLNTTAAMPDGLKGKIVLVDFWSVGCGPCVSSLPAVERVSHLYRAQDVVVLGLHDGNISKSDLSKFARAHMLTYALAIDRVDSTHRSFGSTFKSFGIYGIPSVGVIDRAGVVRYLDYGLEGAISTVGELLAAERK